MEKKIFLQAEYWIIDTNINLIPWHCPVVLLVFVENNNSLQCLMFQAKICVSAVLTFPGTAARSDLSVVDQWACSLSTLYACQQRMALGTMTREGSLARSSQMETRSLRGSSTDGARSKTPPGTPKKVGKLVGVRVLMLDDSVTLFQVQVNLIISPPSHSSLLPPSHTWWAVASPSVYTLTKSGMKILQIIIFVYLFKWN